MRNLFYILLFLYYSIGTFFLPMSNFSILSNLPKMYEHCKETEDKDMTVIDFITDHLLNIDSVFDKHENGDQQKPHKNIDLNIHHTICQIFQEIKTFDFKNPKSFVTNHIKTFNYENSNYSYNYIYSIFRPPIVA